MKKFLLAFLGLASLHLAQGGAAEADHSHFATIIQRCDDVDPGDEDHFE